MQTYPMVLGGQPVTGANPLPVQNPYDDSTPFATTQADSAQLEHAIASCAGAATATAALPAYRRHEVLTKVVQALERDKEDLAQTICAEAGKPYRYAISEVERAIVTFGIAADYTRTLQGEVLPLDTGATTAGRMGLVKRYPIGPVLGIAPFNFPLNLVAHKLAPALLAGCPFLLKPASKTPITALKLGRMIVEAGYPEAAVNVIPFSSKLGDQVVSDERFRLLSFTGSDVVGWPMKRLSGKKKVVLELGGDAAAVIAEDADLASAARQCAEGGFLYAGQVCISIQRIIAVSAVYEEFKELFLRETEKLAWGNPADRATIVGPLIDKENYQRVKEWVTEARHKGAKVLLEGEDAAHNLLKPHVVEDLPADTKLAQNEAFAPYVELRQAPDFSAALQEVNRSRFGLQAAVFTHREDYLKQALNTLVVGGVIANASPTLRIDSMPYGGMKDSGMGREGVRYAYEDMTDLRLLVW